MGRIQLSSECLGCATLRKLRRNNAGSALAMMAAILVPMTILAGSAIDIARVQVVKSRLQQACDAGALAGRKSMTDLTSSSLDATAAAQARAFFNSNFSSGWMTASSVSFEATKSSNNQVNGLASAVVPMTIMSIFGFSAKTVSAKCAARYDVADTDIIFVLDTTGSMACAPNDSDSVCSAYVNSAGTSSYIRPTSSNGVPGYGGTTAYHVPEKPQSRIAALRTAVLNFYDTFAATADPNAHIRYGFVTYTSVVNAGKAIIDKSPGYMVGGGGNATTSWTYQSRKVVGDYTVSSTSRSYYGYTSSSCAAAASPRSPAPTSTNPHPYDPATGTATQVTTSYSIFFGCNITTTKLGPRWEYSAIPLNIASLVAGNTVTDPTKVNGATTRWRGCVEERDTSPVDNFTIGNLPPDLDPDLIPTSDATRWRPLLPDVTYARNDYALTSTATSYGDSYDHPNLGAPTYHQYGYVSCGKPISRLGVMTRSDIANYVNASDFKPIGGTYHDTGMIWGARLLSPNGIFANDTVSWPNSSAAPNRVIVFLTDGAMAPSPYIYGQYGVEFYDHRVTGGDLTNQTSRHNARFLAVCDAAKARNIDIWTVTIGPSISSEMQSCATMPSQALNTTDGSDLSTKFGSIAKRLAMLRLTK